MKNILFAFGMMIIMVGCNNPLNKSITEELSTDELKEINSKDTNFLEFYEIYFENKQYKDLLQNKSLQVQYGDLTFKRLYDYVKQIEDDNFINSIYTEAENEWNAKFGDDENKFDSIIDYWQKHVAENSLDKYLDIEFDHATSYKNYMDKDCVKLYFKITPIKESLKSILLKYKIKTKADKPDLVSSGTLYYFYKISKPILIEDDNEYYYSKNVFYDDIVKNELSNKDIQYKYSFEFSVVSIETDDNVLYAGISEYNEVPSEIKYYIQFTSLTEKGSIIHEYINKEYQSLPEYKALYFDKKKQEIDPLCYKYLKYIGLMEHTIILD